MRELLFIGWLWFGLSIIFGIESTEQETDNQTENVELVQELEIGHGLEAEKKVDLKVGLVKPLFENSEIDEGETYTANFTEEGQGSSFSTGLIGAEDSYQTELINYKGCSIFGCVSSESNKEGVATINPIYDFFNYIFSAPLTKFEEPEKSILELLEEEKLDNEKLIKDETLGTGLYFERFSVRKFYEQKFSLIAELELNIFINGVANTNLLTLNKISLLKKTKFEELFQIPNIFMDEVGLYSYEMPELTFLSEQAALEKIIEYKEEKQLLEIGKGLLIFTIMLIIIVGTVRNHLEDKEEETEAEEDPYENYYSLDRFLYLEFNTKSEDLEAFISKHKTELLTNGAIEHNNELLINPSDTEAITSYIRNYLNSLLFVQNYLISKYKMTPIAADEYVELNEHELLENGVTEVLGMLTVEDKNKLDQFMNPEIKGMIKTAIVVTI